jgi:large repetitive protein
MKEEFTIRHTERTVIFEDGQEILIMQGSAEYKIHVAGASTILLTPGDPKNPTQLPDESAGVAMTAVEIIASGGTGPYTFSVSAGALPDGVTAVSDGVDTLQLSGTPGTAGDFDFTITATDSLGAPAKTAARFLQKVK